MTKILFLYCPKFHFTNKIEKKPIKTKKCK